MKRLALIAVIVLACTGAALAALAYSSRSRPADVAAAATAKVERGDVRPTVQTNGRIISNLDVDIKCKASGAVIKLPFDVSDHVKKGDLLVELDPIDEQHIVAQAQSALESSKADLATAKQNLLISQAKLETARARASADLLSAQAHQQDSAAKADRMKQLLDKKLAAQEDYETAQTAAVQAESDLRNAQAAIDDLKAQELGLEVQRQSINQAQAQVESDQVKLDIAQQALQDTTVLSPMDGVVAVRNVQIGMIISSGITNTGGGTTVLTLSDLSHIFVDASVDESDIGKVRLGQDSDITVDAFPGKHFDGKVVQIATRGVDNSNVVTFDVKIEVTSANMALLKPEMTANVWIVLAEHKNVLMVPNQALTRKDKESTVTLVLPDGATQTQTVETGLSDGVNREITSGLEEGQVVQVRSGLAESKWRQDNPSGAMMMPRMGKH